MLENHLIALYKELGLSVTPKQCEDGSYPVEIDAHRPMRVLKVEPGMVFLSFLVPGPKDEKEEAFIRLMRANFLGQGTGRTRLGLCPKTKKVILSMYIPGDVSYAHFKEDVEEFANYVDYWTETLESKAA